MTHEEGCRRGGSLQLAKESPLFTLSSILHHVDVLLPFNPLLREVRLLFQIDFAVERRFLVWTESTLPLRIQHGPSRCEYLTGSERTVRSGKHPPKIILSQRIVFSRDGIEQSENPGPLHRLERFVFKNANQRRNGFPVKLKNLAGRRLGSDELPVDFFIGFLSRIRG